MFDFLDDLFTFLGDLFDGDGPGDYDLGDYSDDVDLSDGPASDHHSYSGGQIRFGDGDPVSPRSEIDSDRKPRFD